MNRTRSKQELGNLGTMTHHSNYSAIGGPWTHRMSQVDVAMTDVVTPDFKRRLASGEIINNACSKSKVSVYRQPGGSYTAVRVSDPSKYSTVTGNGSLSATYREAVSVALLDVALPHNDLEQAAKSAALAAIDKAPYAVAEDIATIRQTVLFLRKPFSSIVNLADHYRKARNSLRFVRKHGSTLSKAPKNLASLWLEYRFAFLPFCRTIETLMTSLYKSRSGYEIRVQTAHGTASAEKSAKDTVIKSGFTFKRGAKKKVTVRAVVQYRVTPPLHEWQRTYGLRFKDVPELMWDLFPLSFMYDRIWNIGDAVRGLTNFVDPSVTIVGGTVSLTTNLDQDFSMVGQTASGWSVTVHPDTEFFFTENYVRGVWQPSVLNVVPPVLPGGLVRDLTSIADLSALILQRVK